MQHLVLLIIVSDMHIGSQRHRSMIGRNHLIDDLKDRGLPGSVVPDQCHSLAPLDFKVQIAKKLLAGIGLGQMLAAQHIIAACDPWLQLQLDVGIFLRRPIQAFDLIQHFFSGLGTLDGLLPVEGLQLGNDFLLMTDLPLLIVILL